MSDFVLRLLIFSVFLLSFSSPATADSQDDPRAAWSAVASENFQMIANTTPEEGIEIATSLERLRRVFARLSPGLRLRSPLPLRVVAFADHGVYAPYKSLPSPYVLGQYVRSLDGAYLTIDASYVSAGDYQVAYHEYIHHLVTSNFPALPRWFNEGLAEYYSTVVFEDGVAHVGLPVERHLTWIRKHNKMRRIKLDYQFSLYDVLTGEAAHDSRVGGFYAFSWALVHHLLSGGPERMERAADYLARLTIGEDPKEAFEDAFELSFQDLEKELNAAAAKSYKAAQFELDLSDLTVPTAAPIQADSAHLWLGDLAALLGRAELAQRHYEAILEFEPQHADAHAGLAALLDQESRFDEAEVLFQDAMKFGPTGTRTYLRYGRHLLARLQPGEAEFLLATGKLAFGAEIAATPGGDLFAAEERAAAQALAKRAHKTFADAAKAWPDHAGALIYFGASHLYGDVAADEGIRVLQRVRRWVPEDQALVLVLLQLYLKEGELEAAQKLAQRAIHPNNTELAERARWEIERVSLLLRSSEALEKGQIESALRLFDEAIEATQNPDLSAQMIERYAELQDRLEDAAKNEH